MRAKRASASTRKSQASGLVDRLLGKSKGGATSGNSGGGDASAGADEASSASAADDYMARKMAGASSSKSKSKEGKGSRTRTRGSVGRRR